MFSYQTGWLLFHLLIKYVFFMTYLLNVFAYYFNPGVTENTSSLKLKAKDPKDGRTRNCWYLLQSVAHTQVPVSSSRGSDWLLQHGTQQSWCLQSTEFPWLFASRYSCHYSGCGGKHKERYNVAPGHRHYCHRCSPALSSSFPSQRPQTGLAA